MELSSGWYTAAASLVANAFIVAKRQQQPMCQLPIRGDRRTI